MLIPTPRLDLILLTPDEVLASIETMAPAETTPAGDPWALGFAVVERSTGVAVGSCGFKGPPNKDGVVELAYQIKPDSRGRGYATEAAVALATFAFTDGRVRRVFGHTRPGDAESGCVLAKSGFRCVGEVIDPDDGPVDRWELTREPGG